MADFSVVVCASGRGDNFKTLVEKQQEHGCAITSLIVDRPCKAADYARERGIPVHELKVEPGWEERFLQLTSAANLIVLAGFLPILSRKICEALPYRIINLHPSLLPAYGGRGMYGLKVQEAVLAAHESEAGCTVHYVTADIDGGPIISRDSLNINYPITAQELAAQVHELELKLLPNTLATLRLLHNLRSPGR